jgi:hypothetical protein
MCGFHFKFVYARGNMCRFEICNVSVGSAD